MCFHVYACVCTDTWVSKESSKIDVRCLPQLLIMLYTETRSLADSGASLLGLVGPGISISASSAWNHALTPFLM